jgi:hypothetical protein
MWVVRFARLKLELDNALFVPARSSPPFVALRPLVAARSSMSGASWWATRAARVRTRTLIQSARAVRLWG